MLFGYKIQLNNEGTMLGVLAPNNDNAGENAGYIRMYEYHEILNRWDIIATIDSNTSNLQGNTLDFNMTTNGIFSFDGDGDKLVVGFTEANGGTGQTTT